MNRDFSGARNLNLLLQEALNPPGAHSIEKSGHRFSVGDKVMQIQNNYKIITTGGVITATSALLPPSTWPKKK